MDFDINQITTIGFSGVALLGLAWFLKRTLEREGWAETIVEGWRIAVNSFGRATDSIESMNDYMKQSLRSQGDSLEINAVSMDRQEKAGKAFCDFLRHELDTRDITDDSRAELKKKIDDIEEGLTR